MRFSLWGGVHAQDLTIHVNKKGKVGFVDKNGVEVIKCAYESAYPFSEGYAIVTKSGKSGIIDDKGKVVLPLKYTSITPWNSFLYVINSGKTKGLASHNGQIVLPTKYTHISRPNSYGKAWIALGGKQRSADKKTYMQGAKLGIINTSGEILVAPKYPGLYEFANDTKDVFPYFEGMRLLGGYHTLKDTLKTDCDFLGFSSNAQDTDNCGILDREGKIIVKQGMYDIVMKPQGGMVRYYNTSRKQTVCGYHNIDTKKGFVAVKLNGFVDDLKIWTHGDFTGDIAPVNGETWSFIDKSGKVLRKDYKEIKHSLSGQWAAKNASGLWDVFDGYNQDISALSNFENINFPAMEGDQAVYAVKKNEHYGVIDQKGTVIVPFEYDYISSNVYDIIGVMKGSLWGAFTPSGNQIIPLKFKSIVSPIERNAHDFWVLQDDDLYYHFNSQSALLGATGYVAASNFSNGIALVRPKDMKLEESEVNRAQLYAPNTQHSIVAKAEVAKEIERFGYLMNTDNQIIFDLPICTNYVDAVMMKVKEFGNTKLSESAQKNILLEVTKENRSYDLNSTLGEDEWNY